MAGMGHAVMGTAIRSGSNRAIEAAQAAMASPLLEAGAIDGARGILINITGSSSLKLSEVNEASSLIQSSAHEDANIIFGAVLDERIGDEVKITVIATGFRDQMPERRARMLSVEEAPVISVPVVAPDTWFREPVQQVAQAAPRFLSQDEDSEEDEAEAANSPAFVTAPGGHQSSTKAKMKDVQPVSAPARPKFAELAEEPAFVPLPRDYASDFGNGVQVPAELEEQNIKQAVSPFATPAEEPDRDLDVPAFMRRLKF